MDQFFKSRIYFETSFSIPSSISKEMLQEAVNCCASERYPILRAQVRDKCYYPIMNEGKKKLMVEDISGRTIAMIHNEIIALCEKDQSNAFRLFFGVDEAKDHYLIIHAHHGVVDGCFITSFVRNLYSILMTGKQLEGLSFHCNDSLQVIDELKIPCDWNISSESAIQDSIKKCVSTIETPSLYPKQNHGSNRMINMERVLPHDIVARFVSFAKNVGLSSNQKSCMHGLLVYCFAKAVSIVEGFDKEGTISINTIVNMRRYLKEERVFPSICFEAFPVLIPLRPLYEGVENGASIQSRVTSDLNNGLPLAIALQRRFFPEDSKSSSNDDQVVLEISNLGMHPKDCFTRVLITQTAYATAPNNSFTVVVWTDTEGCIHLCLCAMEYCYSQEHLNCVLDELENQIKEVGLV